MYITSTINIHSQGQARQLGVLQCNNLEDLVEKFRFIVNSKPQWAENMGSGYYRVK